MVAAENIEHGVRKARLSLTRVRDLYFNVQIFIYMR